MRTQLVVARRADAQHLSRLGAEHSFPSVDLVNMDGLEELSMLLCLLEGNDPHQLTGTSRVNPFTCEPVPGTATMEASARFQDSMPPDDDADAALFAAPLDLVARLSALRPESTSDLIAKWVKARIAARVGAKHVSTMPITEESARAELEQIRTMAVRAFESDEDLLVWMR